MTLADTAPLLAETAGTLLPYLDDPEVMELMANPDERLFVERFGVGIARVENLDASTRIFILEDDPELRCDAANTASLHTVDGDGGRGRITMTDLVKKALRHRPDLLIIGEVRDGAALDMLRGFQTGHPGMASVHADSAEGTLLRLEQLVQEVSVDPQRTLIAEAVDVIVHMARHGRTWRATGLLAVEGLDGDRYRTRPLVS